MAKAREDYLTRIGSNLNFTEGVEIPEADVILALDSAVDWYSNDRAREKLYPITGDGTNRYALPTDWEKGFSVIIHVEFPAGTSATKDPSLLDQEEVRVWEDNNGEKIQFLFRTLATTDTAWLRYTLRHTLSDSTNSVPDSDFDALCYLAIAIASLTIAGRLLKHKSQAGVSGGIINLRTTSDEYKSYAQEMLKHYYRRMGIPPEQGKPAAMDVFDLDPLPAWGFPWLTHRNR